MQPDPPMIFPTSYAQQRLMIVEQLAPGTAAYHVPFALRLSGVLDRHALARGIETVVSRHEALRTVFTLVDGQAVQIVQPTLPVPVQFRDLRGTPAARHPERLGDLLAEEAGRPFDLKQSALRVALFALADDEHVLAVTLHHLVSDMWSCGIFVRELSVCYAADRAGQRPVLPDLPVQYVDYTIWQRQQLSDAIDRLASFWRAELAGCPPVLELPPDKPRPAAQSFRGDTVGVRLPVEVSGAVERLSRRLGATPFMTMLAAFQAVVGRWTGRRDVVVGTGAATRTAQVEALIGCFINIVVLRTSLTGDPTFAELVGRVRRVALDAFEHQDLPFDKLVEELAPKRDLSYQPLSQVMFVVQNAPLPTPTMAGLGVSAVPVTRRATQLDLDLQLWDAGDHFEGFIEYSSDLFEPETVRRLWNHFETLLTAALADPDVRLSSLPLLAPAELDQVVAGWNDTVAPRPDECLHELFTGEATRGPDRPAVLAPGVRLSYRQLAERSSRVSERLRALGVGPDVVVGLCVGRTVERVVGVLGILQAGGAYLPLDPDYPPDRLAFMLDDARPSVVLTHCSVADRIPVGERTVLLLDADADAPPVSAAAAPAGVGPDNLAYIIYTSGSTGRPKGIAVPHRGVVNNIVDLNRVGAVGPDDRVLALSSLSFDMSVYEVLGLLAAGGTVVLPEPARANDPRHWLELVDEYRVTVWNSAPTLLEALVETAAGRGVTLPSLRLAFLGGDWIPVSLPDRARSTAPALRVVSLGGATEASIHSTIYRVEQTDPDWTSIPYGRPMANQQALILDVDRHAAPVNVPGELHLGGTGLTRGYLHRPALTAERFIPHPYAGRYPDIPAGVRLYRTGDLARYRGDGVIELLGRMDDQVKVRGFRVELGEVASALRSQAGVAEAVVVSRTDRLGENRLVAYVVPVQWPGPTAPDLRAHLKETLPEYMLPSAFVPLHALPLSPNGKVDRAALPAAGDRRPTLASAYTAPRGAIETVLVDAWGLVLRTRPIGVHDDFFELGGHSLAATHIVALIRETFDVEIALRAIFDAPTVAEQAAVVEVAGRAQGVDVGAMAVLAVRVRGMSDDEVRLMLARSPVGER